MSTAKATKNPQNTARIKRLKGESASFVSLILVRGSRMVSLNLVPCTAAAAISVPMPFPAQATATSPQWYLLSYTIRGHTLVTSMLWRLRTRRMPTAKNRLPTSVFGIAR